MSLYNDHPRSVLLVGATGKTGQAILEQLAEHPSKPSVHVLCRDVTKLSHCSERCTSVLKGNARIAYDIEMALLRTQADWVIICVGNGEKLGNENNIRTVNAQATVSVLKKPQYRHVRALVVSSTGAGSSCITIGLGIGKIISRCMKLVLADHTGQEAVFSQIQSRTTIVRASSLLTITDSHSTNKIDYITDKSRRASIKADRADLAMHIADKVCKDTMSRMVNVTSIKQ